MCVCCSHVCHRDWPSCNSAGPSENAAGLPAECLRFEGLAVQGIACAVLAPPCLEHSSADLEAARCSRFPCWHAARARRGGCAGLPAPVCGAPGPQASGAGRAAEGPAGRSLCRVQLCRHSASGKAPAVHATRPPVQSVPDAAHHGCYARRRPLARRAAKHASLHCAAPHPTPLASPAQPASTSPTKPTLTLQNILLDSAGRAKLADFGISRVGRRAGQLLTGWQPWTHTG